MVLDGEMTSKIGDQKVTAWISPGIYIVFSLLLGLSWRWRIFEIGYRSWIDRLFSPVFSMVNFLRVFGRFCLLSKILFQEKQHVRASLCRPAALLIAIWPAALAGFSHPFSVAKIHFYGIHWTGIFTYIWLIFMVQLQVNIPVPWIPWDLLQMSGVEM